MEQLKDGNHINQFNKLIVGLLNVAAIRHFMLSFICISTFAVHVLNLAWALNSLFQKVYEIVRWKHAAISVVNKLKQIDWLPALCHVVAWNAEAAFNLCNYSIFWTLHKQLIPCLESYVFQKWYLSIYLTSASKSNYLQALHFWGPATVRHLKKRVWPIWVTHFSSFGVVWCDVTPLVWCVGHSLFLIGYPVVEVKVESRDVHVKILVILEVVLDRMVVWHTVSEVKPVVIVVCLLWYCLLISPEAGR